MTIRTHLFTAAVIVAGLALAVSAFAPLASAQTMYATTSMTFSRNLTIGSTGADVTALQNWLINKGHSIPAGATGYFGPQTRAALAAYQSASGIAPAAGFFGPITRGRIGANVTPGPAMPVPPVMNNDDDEDDDNDDELEIEVEFRNGRAYIEIDEDGDEDSFTLNTTSRSRVVEEVADRLNMDEEDIEDIIEYVDDEDEDDELEIEVEFRNGRAYVEINEDGDEDNFTLNTTSRTRVIEEVAERLNMDEDEIEDIIEFTNEDDDEDDDNDSDDVRSSVRAVSVDGADNDYAVFRMTFNVEAFGEDIFVPRDAENAFTYRIENASTGATVSGNTTLSSSISSDADEEGSSYLIRENDEEEFTITVNFDPLPNEDGQNYRLQLLTLHYGDEEGEMNESSTLRPEGRFESESVYIAD